MHDFSLLKPPERDWTLEHTRMLSGGYDSYRQVDTSTIQSKFRKIWPQEILLDWILSWFTTRSSPCGTASVTWACSSWCLITSIVHAASVIIFPAIDIRVHSSVLTSVAVAIDCFSSSHPATELHASTRPSSQMRPCTSRFSHHCTYLCSLAIFVFVFRTFALTMLFACHHVVAIPPVCPPSSIPLFSFHVRVLTAPGCAPVAMDGS
jgi:hypothetical protein